MRKLLTIYFLFTICFSVNTASISNRKKVFIVDTGVNISELYSNKTCSGLAQGVGNIQDKMNHGNTIFEIISLYIDGNTECIYPYNASENGQIGIEKSVKGIELAIKLNASVINLSYEGTYFSSKELVAIKKAVDAGIYVVIASGNGGINFDKEGCTVYPACYGKYLKSRFFVVVGGKGYKRGNMGSIIDNYDNYMFKGRSGTSFSTAFRSGMIMQKLRGVHVK